jgi:hypothetical protein
MQVSFFKKVMVLWRIIKKNLKLGIFTDYFFEFWPKKSELNHDFKELCLTGKC